MSKSSKTKSKERRKREKAGRKAAQRARYESYVMAGQNTKSRRGRISSSKKIKVPSTKSHNDGSCGNIGCIRCFGMRFGAYLKNRQPVNMPQWMWMKWQKLSKEERNRVK